MAGRGEDETGRSVDGPSRAHETAAGHEAVEPRALVERLALVKGPTSAQSAGPQTQTSSSWRQKYPRTTPVLNARRARLLRRTERDSAVLHTFGSVLDRRAVAGPVERALTRCAAHPSPGFVPHSSR